MRSAQQVADRVRVIRSRNAQRDQDYMKLIAIRKGDYETVAPGLFNTAEFDKPLVANMVDTVARDIAEVMAPLPSVNCTAASLSNDSDQKRQDLRAAIANSYIQNSRLQDQMFEGADRYGSFGFMAIIVEPDFIDQMPVIRVGDVATAHYTVDYRGRCKEYFEVYKVPVEQIRADYPETSNFFQQKYGQYAPDQMCEVARYYDDEGTQLVLLDPLIVLVSVRNRINRCPVRIVQRPNVTGETRGQFDDVIWVQVARALVAMYTMNALDQSVNAPIAVPKDVQEVELGPMTVIQSDDPGKIGRVNLQFTPGLFPEQQILAQEQRTGSRYPEGRSGNLNASIITGQGVQALMGTFDTQVQTFQRLFTSALEDVMEFAFRMDEAYWGDTKKTRRIKDNGSPRTFTYTPNKDINGEYTVDVSYGAIAGLDPNRGLVFVLQALAGKLISLSTARKSLPVDMNPLAEERQIQLEEMEGAIAAAISQLPLGIPQMAMQGQDPRELVLQITDLYEQVSKGKSPAEAAKIVFAPKEIAQPPVDPAQQALDQAAQQGGPGAPGGMPGGGSSASDLLMSLTGLTPSGSPNMQSMVSRRQAI
ncbi:MAG: hypothetical protein ACXVGN_00045 [Mycobacteriaceae bacterium]